MANRAARGDYGITVYVHAPGASGGNGGGGSGGFGGAGGLSLSVLYKGSVVTYDDATRLNIPLALRAGARPVDMRPEARCRAATMVIRALRGQPVLDSHSLPDVTVATGFDKKSRAPGPLGH